MDHYEFKKVLPIDSNISLEESEKAIISDKFCLGVLDANREVSEFILQEDLLRVLKYNTGHCPVSLISTPAEVVDIELYEIDNADLEKLSALIGEHGDEIIGKIRDIIGK
jgi:hypothetical protein